MCMKYKIPTNIYIIAGVVLGIFAVYIGFSILRRTQEGLTDSPSTVNDDIAKVVASTNTFTEETLTGLDASPQAYIDLLNSYKRAKIAIGISDLVNKQTTTNLINVSDYDEAIDYLKTFAVDASATSNPAMDQIIATNNTNTSVILNSLTADNQAYIDLLTSYKKLKLATGIQTTAGPNADKGLTISEYDIAINYLITLGGNALAPNTQQEPSTTPDISFAKKTTYAE